MVQLNSGDLVRIHYTGRLSSDQSVFETTDEALAKSSGIWSDSTPYGPRVVIVGRGAMIAGLETGLQTLSAGQSGHFSIKADQAFGPRFAELVRVMPEREFAKSGVKAAPNLIVSIDGVPALVKSVSSGRIMLDFNHPLAGQDLEYDVQLIEVITDPAQKAQELAKALGGSVAVDAPSKTVSIPKSVAPKVAQNLEAALKASLEGWTIKIETQ
ncbi:MAG: peptidylprolyl isomerase [Candidatus Micrarchaeota archaeon]|nr:peptidylprolyl isomerase [Candidatus Micrarchaeota archaeon]